MDRTFVVRLVEAAPAGLAVDGDVFARGLEPQRQELGPSAKHLAESRGLQRPEDRQKNVLGRRAVGHR
jgi:hypothetical protein